MAFHPVLNTVEVKFKGDHLGDPRITVLHYRYGPIGGPRPTQAELQDLVHDCRVRVLPYLLQCVNGLTRYTNVTAQDIHDSNGLFAEEVLNPVVYGTLAGEALPGNVQMCLAKHTNVPARRGRGRIFVPDLTENVQVDATINNAYQVLLLDLAAKLLENRGVLRNFVAVVASKKFGSFAPIIAIVFDLITDSMRTRLKNHRRVRRRPASIT